MSQELQRPPGANRGLGLAAAVSKPDVLTSVFYDTEIVFPVISGVIIKTHVADLTVNYKQVTRNNGGKEILGNTGVGNERALPPTPINQSTAAGWILHIAVERKSQILAVNQGGCVNFSGRAPACPGQSLGPVR